MNRDAGASDGGFPGDASSGTGGSVVHGSGGSTSAGTGGAGTGGRFAGSGGAAAGTGGASGTGGAGGGALSCSVSITLVSPTSPNAIEAGPQQKVRVRGRLVNSRFGTAMLRWRWTVAFENGSEQVEPKLVEGDQTEVEFAVVKEGRYFPRADVQADTGAGGQGGGSASPTCTGMTAFQARFAPAKLLFRLAPPRDSMLAESQEVEMSLPSGLSPPSLSLALRAGRMVKLELYQQDRITYLPAFVRVRGSTGSWRIEAHTGQGPVVVFLLEGTRYDLLAVPDLGAAPESFEIDPAVPNLLALEPGIPVEGTVTGANGAPVADVRVVLRAGTRPSTVGVTGPDGRFSLLARPGLHSVTIAAPEVLGWLDAFAGGGSEIGQAVVVGSAGAQPLDFRFAAAPSARFEVLVRGPGGAALPGARAHLRLMDAPVAGTLTAAAGSGAPALQLAATGSARFNADSDDAGRIVWAAVPRGRYRITVKPPVDAAIATVTRELEIQQDMQWTADLPRPGRFTGVLGPAGAAGGARLVAVDPAADVSIPPRVAFADASGAFVLPADPGRTYQIVAEPAAGTPLPRAVLGTFTAPTGDQALAPFTLPAGVSLSGSAVANGRAVPGVFIEIFCAGGTSSCPDRTFSYAETVTAADGSFHAVVPETIVR